jgi:hypothetical protein
MAARALIRRQEQNTERGEEGGKHMYPSGFSWYAKTKALIFP